MQQGRAIFGEQNADKYIKYGTEEIQATLNGLFQGSSGSTGSRK